MIAGSILGVVLAVVSIAWVWSRTAEYERQAYANSRHYVENTGKQVSQACLRLIVVDQPKCATEAADKQRKNERDEQDLVAQRQSALWALVMAIAAVIGMALSFIGVFLVWTTFREARRAAEIAQSNLEAYQQAERGFLHVVDARLVDEEFAGIPDRRRFYFSVENPGRSGVRITRIRTTNQENAIWDWNWDAPNLMAYGSIVPAFCKEGQTGAMAGNFESATDRKANVIFGVIEYQTLGITGCKSHFAFAIDYRNVVTPLLVRMIVLPEMPDDT